MCFLGSRIHPLDIHQEIFPALAEVIMTESPKVGSFLFFFGIDADRVRVFDLTESVKVELADEAGELGMFEELGYDYFFECVWCLDDECCSFFAPVMFGNGWDEMA
jgi:hypothetical protein